MLEPSTHNVMQDTDGDSNGDPDITGELMETHCGDM